MIKLFWNTHNQRNNPEDKEDRDLIWGEYHRDYSNKWIHEILNKIQFKSIKNESPVKINAIIPKKENIIKVVTSRSHANNPKLDKFLENYPKYELIKMGSSIKICLVADGSAHIYPRLGPTMEWDTAAAHAVVKYAGGNIYDLNDMNELVYNKSNLLNPEFLVNNL